ncbi:alpha/beta hydrolase [Chondromyces apiculatus]|uniref:Serine aminopeptidase S33 domain-containing protein n=1 Tax=Chondromyces apiculatus DSM 436 TaxID=1192034 RepID=A0A017T362_9BACT|nr:alpha/beta fold hydrolase [Chondromyces apiculatus]EYF03432.1 Hypothetical protein CAP_5538 [Chondromyces apiculatus DSM 436]
MNKPAMLAATLTLAAASALTAAPALASGPVIGMMHVDEAEFTVDFHGQPQQLKAFLYYRNGLGQKPLQVVVHGSTYNHAYWDAPTLNGHDYSYARYMADAGYAVLAIDKLGAGRSDRPDGDLIDIGVAVSNLDQILDAMRTTHNPFAHRFTQIALVGHSLGSITSIVAEGKHNNADALIVTGQALTPHTIPFPDEMFADMLSAPYGFVKPEHRAQYFYYAPSADPDIIAWDNGQIRDFVPRGEITSGLPLLADPVTMGAHNITAPVLIQLGQYDDYAPASLAPQEPAYYTSAASVTVEVLRDTGHDFNFHLTNETGWSQIDAWLDTIL